jgi:hypothetical protein
MLAGKAASKAVSKPASEIFNDLIQQTEQL